VSQIQEEVTSFIVNNFLFGKTDEAPNPTDSFMETGLIDSTGILQVVVFLEDKYGITVGDEDLVPSNLDSVENIAKFVQRKRGE
jgi:acyl carrier protein